MVILSELWGAKLLLHVHNYDSPLMAAVPYSSGTTLNIILPGIGSMSDGNFLKHAVKLKDKADSEVSTQIRLLMRAAFTIAGACSGLSVNGF